MIEIDLVFWISIALLAIGISGMGGFILATYLTSRKR